MPQQAEQFELGMVRSKHRLSTCEKRSAFLTSLPRLIFAKTPVHVIPVHTTQIVCVQRTALLQLQLNYSRRRARNSQATVAAVAAAAASDTSAIAIADETNCQTATTASSFREMSLRCAAIAATDRTCCFTAC
ncbi:hypothetical protein LSTR_LSTR000675 [Laodelphax striatellus]|uniref:Uncharacterized protein n=1 Tax=Laodelphax striatellus TaxID=195883 RepID=A0A482XG17_LAOST|nr:hypothetical protein LSTR_LSTR000675 [Laodelphax striatellus]